MLEETLTGQLVQDLVLLPASAFDHALVTDVYKPRMHQVLLVEGRAPWQGQGLQLSQPCRCACCMQLCMMCSVTLPRQE